MSTPNPLPSRRAHSVPVHPSLRRHRRQVLRWAFAHGHLVQRDALAAIVAVRGDMSTGVVQLRWSAEDIAHVLHTAVPAWCRTHGVLPPEDVATTLATYLRHLDAEGQLGAGSGSPALLRRTVADERPGPQRSRARHPSSGRPAPVLPIG